jgi:hypothetical protein
MQQIAKDSFLPIGDLRLGHYMVDCVGASGGWWRSRTGPVGGLAEAVSRWPTETTRWNPRRLTGGGGGRGERAETRAWNRATRVRAFHVSYG